MNDSAAPKRALFISITDYPGGAERVTFGLASELARRPDWQVEVKIVCSRLPDSFSRRILPPNVRVGYGLMRNWFLSFPLLPFRLMFRRYDLVFTSHVYTNALLSLLRRLRLLRTRKLVVRESMSLFDRFGGLKAKRFPLLYRAYGGEDAVIAQTSYMADHVRPWLPSRSAKHLQVLPNPVDAASIQSAAGERLPTDLQSRLEGRRNVLFCGRFEPFKRPDAALQAFRIACADIPDAQLVFLGSGPLEEEVRRQAAEAGLGERVLFLGFQSNPYPVMAACQYGLVTSANEGFPNVVTEMMACGLRKIVVTPCAGDLDLLPAIGLTQTLDEREIADALRSAMMTDEDCGATYRKFAATRSVSAYLEAVLGLSLAGESPRALEPSRLKPDV